METLLLRYHMIKHIFRRKHNKLKMSHLVCLVFYPFTQQNINKTKKMGENLSQEAKQM